MVFRSLCFYVQLLSKYYLGLTITSSAIILQVVRDAHTFQHTSEDKKKIALIYTLNTGQHGTLPGIVKHTLYRVFVYSDELW